MGLIGESYFPGDSLILEGGKWVEVLEVDEGDGQLWVSDEDGDTFWVSPERVASKELQ